MKWMTNIFQVLFFVRWAQGVKEKMSSVVLNVEIYTYFLFLLMCFRFSYDDGDDDDHGKNLSFEVKYVLSKRKEKVFFGRVLFHV